MRITKFAIAAQGVLLGLGLGQSAFGQSGRPQMSALSVDVPSAVFRSLPVNHAAPSQILHVSISLPYGDPEGMQALVDSVSDPKSPNYRHYITPQEVGARFGMSSAFVSQVGNYLTGHGFRMRLISQNHLSILADCTVAQAERAFHTTINNYWAMDRNEPGRTGFFAFSRPLQMPASIAPYVLDVAGLENYTKPQARTLTPTQTRVLYKLAPIYNNGMQGQGRNVAISNFDGFRLSNVPLYYSQYGLPVPGGGVNTNVQVVPISGGAGGGTPGAEGDLDIQMVLGMAPLCNFTIYDGGGSDLIGVLSKEVNDNLADVISESYGWNLPSSMATSAHNLHLSMSAQGITYMAASGDSGTSLEPYSYPDYDPDVLMVGGSISTTDTVGNRTSEAGWSGSGGGWSTNTASFNTRPSWQTGNGVPTSVNFRLVPDVALQAAGSSSGAYYFYLNGSLTNGYDGTSFASPVFAGALAVAEQKIISLGGLPPNGAGKRRLGRVQDLFYAQNGRSDVWYDITSGNNGTLPNGGASNAGVGWDSVTGWGAINFDAFVATQATTNPDFSISASPSSQTVLQGNGTSYTTTINALNGFTGTTSLAVSGLPTGASASFNPTSVSGAGSSTLSVSTANSTPVGTYVLTITGTSGTLVHTATVNLTVTSSNPPNFTVVAAPSSRTVNRGSSTTYTVTVAAQNGFTGTVNLTVTGNPYTATFSPTSVRGSGVSTLTVRTRFNTGRATYTLTVRGTSGQLTHTSAVTLVVR